MAFDVLSHVQATPFPADWYDAASTDHFWIQWRFRALQLMLREQGVSAETPLTALDIGCGSGVLRTQLEAATAWTVDGADVNREALARGSGGRGRTMLYNIHDRLTELAERYDVLLLFDVIEHIEEPGAFLKSALAHLKPGGIALVNVPALQRFYSVYDEIAGHFRRYDKASLTRALVDAGMEPRGVRYWGGSLIPLLALRGLVLQFRRANKDVIQLGFVPPAPWVSAILRGMMYCEIALIPRPWLGSSVIAMAVKPEH